MERVFLKRLPFLFFLFLVPQHGLIAKEDHEESIRAGIRKTRSGVKADFQWEAREFMRWFWRTCGVTLSAGGGAFGSSILNHQSNSSVESLFVGATVGAAVGVIWAWFDYEHTEKQNELELDLEVVRQLKPERVVGDEKSKELAIKQANLLKQTYGAPPNVTVTQSKQQIEGMSRPRVKVGYTRTQEQNHEAIQRYRADLMMTTAENSNNWTFTLREDMARAFLKEDTEALAYAVRKSLR